MFDRQELLNLCISAAALGRTLVRECRCHPDTLRMLAEYSKRTAKTELPESLWALRSHMVGIPVVTDVGGGVRADGATPRGRHGGRRGDGAAVRMVNGYGYGKADLPARAPKLHAVLLPYDYRTRGFLTLCGRTVHTATNVPWDSEGVGRRCQMCVKMAEGAIG